MVGSAPPPQAPDPSYRQTPAHAPIFRIRRELDITGAKPDRETAPLRPIGHLGTRVDLIA